MAGGCVHHRHGDQHQGEWQGQMSPVLGGVIAITEQKDFADYCKYDASNS